MTAELAGDEESIRVFVYWDYACPHSYLSLARMTVLAEEFPLEVWWRPLASLGDGSATAAGGAPPWSVDLAELSRAAADLDLPFVPPDFVPRTTEALQAAEFARDLDGEAFDRLHRRLFHAYFVEGRDIGERDIVLDCADSVGLDREGLERALEDARYERELDKAEAEAARYGIGGTPAFLFGRLKLLGAAPLSELRRASRRARDEG